MARGKSGAKQNRPRTRDVSALAWIQDAYGSVLLVRQVNGRGLWSLPGGKVGPNEPIKRALRRELREEIGLTVVSAVVLDLFDRPEKGGLAVLFRAVLRRGILRLGEAEICDAAFVDRLPRRATPTVRYFWARHFDRRGVTSALEP